MYDSVLYVSYDKPKAGKILTEGVFELVSGAI